MRVLHKLTAKFDDPNLVGAAGLAPAVAMAGRAGLADLVADRVTVFGPGAANAHVKVPAIVAGMVAGAGCIDDMDLLRHGGMGRLFIGVRAPSTLGTFLRTFTFGHVRQLDAVASRFVAALAGQAPLFAAGGGITYVDIDDTIKATHGYGKQGVGYGYNGVKGLNALIATASTAASAPIIVATRLRRGNTNSARGAARLVADALKTTASCGATGCTVLRADSAYYGYEPIAAARRAGAHFSITARMNPTITKAIAAIDEAAWVAIKYPNAVWEDDGAGGGYWVSDAQVAEVPFTAFTSRRKTEHVTGRLIVRRVKRLNPKTSPAGQGELFAAWRYHAVFTDSPRDMLDAETDHRAHAIIEQVHADLRSGPLAHMPSGSFNANGAWLVLATIAFNLTRTVGALASVFHAKATTGTIRAQLINIPARLARSARRLTMHLPESWPWQRAWQQLFDATCGPPTAATP